MKVVESTIGLFLWMAESCLCLSDSKFADVFFFFFQKNKAFLFFKNLFSEGILIEIFFECHNH